MTELSTADLFCCDSSQTHMRLECDGFNCHVTNPDQCTLQTEYL